MRRIVFLSLMLWLCPVLFARGVGVGLDTSGWSPSQLSNFRVDRLPEKTEFTARQLYAPGSLIIAGIALSGNSPGGVKQWIVKERDKLLPNFRVRVDDYLQFSPIAIAYGLDALGIKSRNDFQNRTAILLKGELVMLATTRLLKDVTRVRRPSGAGHSSFPSGHTAQAFAAAVFLSEEYKRNLPWVPYLSYGIASSVGLLRLANNKHYIDDVLVGAGMGYLSMKLSYWTHRHKWNKKRAHRPSRAKSGW